MFFGCLSLKELNLNNFNTNNVIDMSYMFDECKSLEKLYINNFNINEVTENMKKDLIIEKREEMLKNILKSLNSY